MTFLWRIASDCPDGLIAVHGKDSVDPTLFRKAIPFNGAHPVRFVFHGRRSAIQEEQYFPNSAMLPLVSKRAGYHLLDLAGGAVQEVPALLICDDGEIEVSLMNPLHAKSAVDWMGSKAVYIPGTKQVMKFEKLRLLPGVLHGNHLARLDEYRPFILVSEEMRSLFAGSNLCEFVLVSDIRA